MASDTVEKDAGGDDVTLTLEILGENDGEVVATGAEAAYVLRRAEIRIAPGLRMAQITMPRRVAQRAGWIE